MKLDEKDELFLNMYQKTIKHIEIAEHLECSNALISLYFKNKANMSREKVEKMKEFIANYPDKKG